MRTTTTDPLIRYRMTCTAYDEASAAVEQLDDIMSTDSLGWMHDETWNLLEEAYHQIVNVRQSLACDVETAAANLLQKVA